MWLGLPDPVDGFVSRRGEVAADPRDQALRTILERWDDPWFGGASHSVGALLDTVAPIEHGRRVSAYDESLRGLAEALAEPKPNYESRSVSRQIAAPLHRNIGGRMLIADLDHGGKPRRNRAGQYMYTTVPS